MPSRRAVLAAVGATALSAAGGCFGDSGTGADPVQSDPVTGDARSFQYDAGNRGWHAGRAPTDDPEVTWRQVLVPYPSGPLVAGTTVYLVDNTGYLVALDRRHGGWLWERELAWSGDGMPALVGDTLFVPAFERGRVPVCLGLDPADGAERWRVDAGGHVTPAGDDALVGGAGTGPLSLVGTGGAVRWTVMLPAHASRPAVAGDTAVVGLDGGQVRGVADGAVQWRRSVPGDAVSAPTATDDAIFVGTQAGVVVRLDTDGSQRWRTDVGETVTDSATLADGTLYVPTGEAVVALHTADGSQRWRSDRASGAALTAANGTLFGVRENHIVALDAADGGQRWSLQVYRRRYADGVISAVRTTPVAVGDQLLVAAQTGDVFALR